MSALAAECRQARFQVLAQLLLARSFHRHQHSSASKLPAWQHGTRAAMSSKVGQGHPPVLLGQPPLASAAAGVAAASKSGRGETPDTSVLPGHSLSAGQTGPMYGPAVDPPSSENRMPLA